jgi:hypothetical protein
VDAEAAALAENAQPPADGTDLHFDAGRRHTVILPSGNLDSCCL